MPPFNALTQDDGRTEEEREELPAAVELGLDVAVEAGLEMVEGLLDGWE